jgi:hypothetical protein
MAESLPQKLSAKKSNRLLKDQRADYEIALGLKELRDSTVHPA